MKCFVHIALTSFVVFLASCGGSSDNSATEKPTGPPPPPSNYLHVSGKISAPGGVAADSLIVVSLGRESGVDDLGSYSADVHPAGVSLVIAGQENHPFALARFVVADAGLNANAVNIDTTSTAVSLVFASPFILTQDPVEAARRLALIENDVHLPSLAQAVDDAFNDADPLQNAALLSAWENTLYSVADQLGAVSDMQSSSQKSMQSSSNMPKAMNRTKFVRLPKRSSAQLFAAEQATAISTAIDIEFTNINVEASGDRYFLRPTSSLFNAVDWFVEVGEIDYSGFRYTHQLEPMLADPYTVYPRVGPVDEPVGIDINPAQGVYRWLEFVSMGLNWLVDQIQNRISPEGISVSQVDDGLYIVRSFSSGTAGDAAEYDFVQNKVPNGALNNRRARNINHISAAMDILGVAIDFFPLMDDTVASDCLHSALIELYKDSSVSIKVTNSVVSEVNTTTEMAQDMISTFSLCVVGHEGITSATGLGWLNNVWSVVTGIASIPVTGAQLTERYTFMFVRATPLESMVIQVGSPIVDDNEPPTIPANLAATPISTSQIQLQWSESSDNDDVAEYIVYRDDNIVGSTDALSLKDSGLSASTMYCYEIEAFDFAGNPSGRSSPPVCATTFSVPDTTPPTVPQNVIAEVISDTAIDVSWDPSIDDRGVTEYVVYRDDEPIQTVSGNAISDTGLVAGTQYCYTVEAYDAAGHPSGPSSPPTCATTTLTTDTTAPTAPTGVAASAISDTEIRVTWDSATDNVAVTGYRIFRDTVPVDTTTELNYLDNSLSASTTYCYSVSAFDAVGNESLPSTTSACATTLAAPDTTSPSVPTGLMVTVVSSSQIDLNWDAATDDVGVTGYNIYRDNELHDTVADLSYSDTGLVASTQYCYTLTAVDAAGNESGQSATVCGTTESEGSSPEITKILDSNTTLPGGGSFSCSGVPPIVSKDGKLLFLASDFYGPLFLVEGGSIRRVAATGDPLPGNMPAITGFAGIDVDGTETVFSTVVGVYKEDAGALSLIADVESTTPPGNQTYGGFYDVAADSGLVTFRAGSDSAANSFGIYQYDGNSIEVVADVNTADPGRPGVLPNSYENLSSRGGLVVFGASDFSSGYAGLYAFDGNDLISIASTDAAFSNGRDIFDSAKNTIDINRRILFTASDGTGTYPFYQWLTGSLTLAIDVPMVISGTNTVLYTWKNYWASDVDKIVTQNLTDDGKGNSEIGLYLHQNSLITKVVDTSELIDGKEAYDLFPLGIDGNSLVFLPWFVDDSCGLYTISLGP